MSWLKSFWKSLNTPLPQEGSAAPRREYHQYDDAMNNFTPRAQKVLALAREEADRFHHNFVGTEHVLLGLIRLGQGTAVKVLEQMGVILETVRLEIEKQVGTGPDQRVFGNIPYTAVAPKIWTPFFGFEQGNHGRKPRHGRTERSE